jgi:hypothetical protein
MPRLFLPRNIIGSGTWGRCFIEGWGGRGDLVSLVFVAVVWRRAEEGGGGEGTVVRVGATPQALGKQQTRHTGLATRLVREQHMPRSGGGGEMPAAEDASRVRTAS